MTHAARHNNILNFRDVWEVKEVDDADDVNGEAHFSSLTSKCLERSDLTGALLCDVQSQNTHGAGRSSIKVIVDSGSDCRCEATFLHHLSRSGIDGASLLFLLLCVTILIVVYCCPVNFLNTLALLVFIEDKPLYTRKRGCPAQSGDCI